MKASNYLASIFHNGFSKRIWSSSIASLLIGISTTLNAQMQITFPQERMVFQRNNANESTIQIEGNIKGSCDAIDYRLIDLQNQTISQWKKLDSRIEFGRFKSKIKLQGGWYSLQVRGIYKGKPVDYANLSKVGVGEVFVVAGQSNATGSIEIPSGNGANDDRVNTVDFQNLNRETSEIKPFGAILPPYIKFVHLDKNTRTAPFGNYAWCWGQFGDQVVKELGVPVMIYNAGWSATSARNWRESIQTNSNSVNANGIVYPVGLPFGHLRMALSFYTRLTGVRAVLWHQGEFDNLENRTREQYRNDLKEVINASRKLTGNSDLAWFISRASRFKVMDSFRNWDPVIKAQNDLIGLNDKQWQIANIYPGPETDTYYTSEYRVDGIHFSGVKGATILANLWFEAINESIETIQAIPARVDSSYDIQNHSEKWLITSKENVKQIKWHELNDINKTIGIQQEFAPTKEGYYFFEGKDTLDNIHYSPIINIQSPIPTVDITQFNGYLFGSDSVKIAFKTQTKKPITKWELSTSSDLIQFKKIADFTTSIKDSLYQSSTWKNLGEIENSYFRFTGITSNGERIVSRILSLEPERNLFLDFKYKTEFIYPNPAKDIVYFNSNTWEDVIDIKLYSDLGHEMKIEVDLPHKQIRWQPLETGIYHVLILHQIGDNEYFRLLID